MPRACTDELCPGSQGRPRLYLRLLAKRSYTDSEPELPDRAANQNKIREHGSPRSASGPLKALPGSDSQHLPSLPREPMGEPGHLLWVPEWALNLGNEVKRPTLMEQLPVPNAQSDVDQSVYFSIIMGLFWIFPYSKFSVILFLSIGFIFQLLNLGPRSGIFNSG